MADKTGISWTDSTWSPVVGCSRVSEGCRNCYSERLVATRLRHTEKYSGLAQMTQAGPRWTNVVRCVEEALIQPLRWVSPKRIFVNSMSDTFHKDVPTAFLDRMFIVMAMAGHHTFQVLTKRPERAAEYMSDPDLPQRIDDEYLRWANEATETSYQRSRYRGSFLCRVQRDGVLWPLPNVWIGTSVEDQAAADARIPHLLQIPAAVRFFSCEPLLGPVNLHRWLLGFDGGNPAACECGHGHGFTRCPNYGGVSRTCHVEGCDCPGFSKRRGADGVHWVICGGESGPNARPMHPGWPRSLRDQCKAASVPFHFKQVGEWDALEHHDQHEWESAYSGEIVDGNAFPDFDDARTKGWDRDIEEGLVFRRLGVRATGHLLDGVEHLAFPEVARAR